MPPLERVEIRGQLGWLESVWGGIVLEVRVGGREGNLCSRKCVIVWIDEVTD